MDRWACSQRRRCGRKRYRIVFRSCCQWILKSLKVSLRQNKGTRVLPLCLSSKLPLMITRRLNLRTSHGWVAAPWKLPHSSRIPRILDNFCHMQEQTSIMTNAISLKGSRPCHIRFRLVTAFNFPRINAHLTCNCLP